MLSPAEYLVSYWAMSSPAGDLSHGLAEALSLTPFTLLQLEEALTYKMQDEASMDRGLLYNSKKGRLVDEIFQSLLTILLTEEVAEETEDLKTHVGNRSTHTRGGKLAIHSLYSFNHNCSHN